MDRKSDPPASFKSKAAGWIIAIGSVAVGCTGLAIAQPIQDRRVERALAFTPDSLWWAQGQGWLMSLMFAAALAPFFLVPGAFGVEYRQIVPHMPRGKWWLAGVSIVNALLAPVIFSAVSIPMVGRADEQGVIWTRNAKTIAQYDWSDATLVNLSCRVIGEQDGADYYGLDVTVYFPGRKARLGPREAVGSEPTWFKVVEAAIDQSRDKATFEGTIDNEACEPAARDNFDDPARFLALVRGSPKYLWKYGQIAPPK